MKIWNEKTFKNNRNSVIGSNIFHTQKKNKTKITDSFFVIFY